MTVKRLLTFLLIVFLVGCSGVQLTTPAVSCERDGESYAVGAGDIPARDGCNTCFCAEDGELNCTKLKCETGASDQVPGSSDDEIVEDVDKADDTDLLGLANPAAVRCKTDGFVYEIREDAEGSQTGYCIDEENRECIAWEYFRGECMLGEEILKFEAELEDVTGGDAHGTATATYSADNYVHTVVARDMPDLEEGYFYEGWLIRTLTFDVISSGKMVQNEEGAYTLRYETPENLIKHTRVVITLEPDDDDPDPADHVLEGTLKEAELES